MTEQPAFELGIDLNADDSESQSEEPKQSLNEEPAQQTEASPYVPNDSPRKSQVEVEALLRFFVLTFLREFLTSVDLLLTTKMISIATKRTLVL